MEPLLPSLFMQPANTQRLNFTTGDFGLLFYNRSISIDEHDGGGGGGGHAYLIERGALR